MDEKKLSKATEQARDAILASGFEISPRIAGEFLIAHAILAGCILIADSLKPSSQVEKKSD